MVTAIQYHQHTSSSRQKCGQQTSRTLNAVVYKLNRLHKGHTVNHLVNQNITLSKNKHHKWVCCCYIINRIIGHVMYLQLLCSLAGAWIVTGGTNDGVMKYVGEAVQKHVIAHGNKSPIIAIGIAPWGGISDRDVLVNKQVCILAQYI